MRVRGSGLRLVVAQEAGHFGRRRPQCQSKQGAFAQGEGAMERTRRLAAWGLCCWQGVGSKGRVKGM